MKTSEFIKKVNELGYKINVDMYNINVHRENGIIAIVAINKSKKLDTLWDEYMTDYLFDVCVEYAKTPIEEREEHKGGKKYYLYNEFTNSYLNYLTVNKTFRLDSDGEVMGFQTKFTEEEIKKYNLENSGILFERIEVE